MKRRGFTCFVFILSLPTYLYAFPTCASSLPAGKVRFHGKNSAVITHGYLHYLYHGSTIYKETGNLSLNGHPVTLSWPDGSKHIVMQIKNATLGDSSCTLRYFSLGGIHDFETKGTLFGNWYYWDGKNVDTKCE